MQSIEERENTREQNLTAVTDTETTNDTDNDYCESRYQKKRVRKKVIVTCVAVLSDKKVSYHLPFAIRINHPLSLNKLSVEQILML